MTTKFSQFNAGASVRTSDITVGLRGSVNEQFTNGGIADSLGNYIVSYSQPVGPGSAVNYVNILSAFTGNFPTISAKGTDVNINLILSAQGASGFVDISGNTAVILPNGTTGQRPVGQTGMVRLNTTTGLLEFWNSVTSAWESSGSSILSSITFVTNTDATATLPNSQPLSALATGIMKVTTATGIVSSLAIPLIVSDGGTGLSTTTAYGLITGGTVATGNFQNAGTGTAGQVYISNGAAALGTWANLITGSWIDQTTSPVSLTANTGYVSDNAGLVTFNMPALVPFGTQYEIRGYGSGGWLVQFNGGQTGHLNSTSTTAGGTFASTERYDCISILCTVANTTFVCTSSGVITNA